VSEAREGRPAVARPAKVLLDDLLDKVLENPGNRRRFSQ
jgi:hypothetical protein